MKKRKRPQEWKRKDKDDDNCECCDLEKLFCLNNEDDEKKEVKIKVYPSLTNAILHEAVTLRRHFHRHPELSYKEKNTAEFIVKELKAYVHTHNSLCSVLGEKEIETKLTENIDGTHGIVFDLVFGEGKTIMFRADMDALPIHETTNAEYTSVNEGVSHACGHDAHMAILLTVAKVLLRDRKLRHHLQGVVRLIFQPAEEGGAGAKRMIAGKCLEDVDMVFGLHVWNFQTVGTIGVCEGAITANSDRFEIVVTGKGGHGSQPQATVDPIIVGAQVVTALQTIVSRSVDPFAPAVVSIGTFHSGDAANVIAGSATMKGTVRTKDERTKEIIIKRMGEICTGIATATGATIDLNYRHGYPATKSTRSGALLVRRAASKVLSSGDIRLPYKSLAGEDMSYYLNEKPGAFFFVGSCSPENLKNPVPHHRSDFNIDERALSVGTSIFLHIIANSLTNSDDKKEEDLGDAAAAV